MPNKQRTIQCIHAIVMPVGKFSRDTAHLVRHEGYARKPAVMLLLIFLLVPCVRSNGTDRLFHTIGHMREIEDDLSIILTEDVGFKRTISFTFPPHFKISCISAAGDRSFFSEQFFQRVHQLIPPIVLFDREDVFQCSAVIVAVDDGLQLRSVLRVLPRHPHYRIWCLVNNSTLSEMYALFENNLSDFGDANVIILQLNHFSHALMISQPDRVLEIVEIFENSTWPLITDSIKAFRGKNITYSTGECDIHSHFIEERPEGDIYWGLDWKVFQQIIQGMDLTYTYVEVADPNATNIFGYHVNNTWTGGILGNLFNGVADVGFCGIFFERYKYETRLQMSIPLRSTCIKYAVRHPKRRIDWRTAFLSFTKEVWAVLTVSIVLFATSMRTMTSKIGFFQHEYTKRFKSWLYCWLITLGMLFQGSYPRSTYKLRHLRLFVFLWSLLSIIISALFSSQLVSNFARPSYYPKPKNLKELVSFGYESAQMTVFPLRTVLDPDDANSREWIDRFELMDSYEDLRNAIDTNSKLALQGRVYDNSVFILTDIDILPEDLLDKYQTTDECIADLYEGFAFRRSSPFLDPVNKYILRLTQHGFIDKFTRETLLEITMSYPSVSKITKSSENPSKGSQPISMLHLLGAFMAFFVGLTLSIITFSCELLVHRIKSTDTIQFNN